jgi:hypothetical protein
MDVLARAEGDRRLVRPIRVEIERPLDDKSGREANPSSLVEARIELDAVFSTGVAAHAAGEDQP